jgi:hypothetical protein
MKLYNLVIPIGLPGCGKTFYGNKHYKNYGLVLDADKLFKNGKGLDDIIEEVNKNFEEYQTIYLDGLFTTKKTIDKLLDIKLPGKDIGKIIVAWTAHKKDRDNCIINDNIRGRKESAYNTIVHSPSPYIPMNNDTRISKITVNEVKNYDFLDGLVEEADIYSTNSQEYTLPGSTYGIYWHEDGPLDLSADIDDYDLVNEDSFSEILKLFDLSVSDLSETTLTKCRSIVEYHENSEGDYYGGRRYYCYYEYDAKDMIRHILKYHFDIQDINEENIMDKIPERFL